MKLRVLVAALVLFIGKPLFSQTAEISQSAKTDHPAGCKADARSDVPSAVFSDNIAALTYFLNGLQVAIKEDRPDKVAKFMHYPLLAGSYKPIHVHSEREFIAGYDKLFPADLRQLILRQRPACIHWGGSQGFTIGLGSLWFDVYDDGKVRAFTINPVLGE